MTDDPERSPTLHRVTGRPSLGSYAEDLASRREFILLNPANELRARNMDTVLGNFWYLVNPLLLTGVYFVVFGVLLSVDRGIENYLGYLVIGLLTFNMISASAVTGSNCLNANEALMRSLYFPRALLPLSAALTQLYIFLPSLVVMFVVVAVEGVRPTLRWLALPAAVIVIFLFSAGLALVAARMGRAVRDLNSLLPHLFRMAFYLSGILYAPAAITENRLILRLFDLNPFYVMISLMRWSLLGIDLPSSAIPVAVAWSVLLATGGLVYFWRGEPNYGR